MSKFSKVNAKDICVLYVEDDEFIMKHLKLSFEKIFKKLYTAHDGQEGLELYRKHRDEINMVVSDIRMPNLNGIEMCYEIRRIDFDMPIIFTTAYSDKEFLLDAIEIGVSGYVIKPFNLIDLITKIKDVYYPIYQHKKTQEHERKLLEQSKLASMGEMIGNIAHQWRQPLAGISAAVMNIEHKVSIWQNKNESNHELDKLFKTIEDKHNRINNYTHHLSDTIDIFRNFIKEDKELKSVIIQDVIDESLYLMEATLHSTYIKLDNNVKNKETVYIRTIKSELAQVIMNIIYNAKDAIGQNNIKEPWIKIDLEITDDKVIITIEDNAGGIPENVMPKIFDPYFTTKHQSQGTGLGLHMGYKIVVDSLKGDLYVKNTQNGAKFFIELIK
ncbi:MAG: response regulator [Campylobacterota bacterium]|nr:response regulator [Campylobacterota bacterium]